MDAGCPEARATGRVRLLFCDASLHMRACACACACACVHLYVVYVFVCVCACEVWCMCMRFMMHEMYLCVFARAIVACA